MTDKDEKDILIAQLRSRLEEQKRFIEHLEQKKFTIKEIIEISDTGPWILKQVAAIYPTSEGLVIHIAK